jgi:hypothetical protein
VANADWPADRTETPAVAIFLLIILIAVALGIIGAVIKGLIFLLVIGIIIFLASFVIFGFRLRGRRHRPSR